MTGAGGFAGRHLVEHLAASGDEVIASDAVPLQVEDFGEGVECAVLDVTDEQACWELLNTCRPTVVYHLAGIAHVMQAEQDPARCLAVNRDGTRNMLAGCLDGFANVRFLLVSTAEVYGRVEPDDLPVRETHPLRPSTVYALSKAQAEMELHLAVARGLHAVIARAFNHIGPGQSDDFVTAAFAHQIARIEAGLQEPIMHVGNLEAMRDFSDVADTVAAYRLFMQHGTPGEVLNITGGSSISIQSILDTLISLARVEVTVEQDAARMRPVDVPVFHGSCERLRERCGRLPDRPLSETLEKVLAYWRASVERDPER